MKKITNNLILLFTILFFLSSNGMQSIKKDWVIGGFTFEIAMDGGINTTNIHSLYVQGCTTFYIASAIFSSKNIVHETQLLYEKALEG